MVGMAMPACGIRRRMSWEKGPEKRRVSGAEMLLHMAAGEKDGAGRKEIGEG